MYKPKAFIPQLFLGLGFICLLMLSSAGTAPAETGEKGADMSSYQAQLGEYDAIIQTMDKYIEGGRQGSGKVMSEAFHAGANIYAFSHGEVVGGPIQLLYDLVDSKAPAGTIEYSIASIELETDIAMVRLEIPDWNGAHYTDMFTLLKTESGEWKIISKVSHIH